MAGCYGNSAEDRYYENMLFEYLKKFDDDEEESEEDESEEEKNND